MARVILKSSVVLVQQQQQSLHWVPTAEKSRATAVAGRQAGNLGDATPDAWQVGSPSPRGKGDEVHARRAPHAVSADAGIGMTESRSATSPSFLAANSGRSRTRCCAPPPGPWLLRRLVSEWAFHCLDRTTHRLAFGCIWVSTRRPRQRTRSRSPCLWKRREDVVLVLAASGPYPICGTRPWPNPHACCFFGQSWQYFFLYELNIKKRALLRNAHKTPKRLQPSNGS